MALSEGAQPSLLDLLREFREHIYTLCLWDQQPDLTAHRRRPYEPPITRVSKATRDEALPLYYEAFTMTVQTNVKCDSHGNIWLRTKRWHRSLPSVKVSWLRSMRLRFGFVERYFGEPVTMEFTIRLSKRDNGFTIEHSFGAGWFSDVHRTGDPAACEKEVLVLKNHLTSGLTKYIDEGGIGKLQAADIDRLVDVDPAAFD